MKYTGMPAAMWLLFAKSFRQQLVENYHMNEDTAKEVTAKAKLKYKQIIQGLPEFEKNDRFKANAVSCAMLGAFVLNMPGTSGCGIADEVLCKCNDDSGHAVVLQKKW